MACNVLFGAPDTLGVVFPPAPLQERTRAATSTTNGICWVRPCWMFFTRERSVPRIQEQGRDRAGTEQKSRTPQGASCQQPRQALETTIKYGHFRKRRVVCDRKSLSSKAKTQGGQMRLCQVLEKETRPDTTQLGTVIRQGTAGA